MKILIMSAMVEEIDYLVTGFSLNPIDKINGNDLYKIEGTENTIYILNCGIGKVNSSITTSMFITKYPVDKIISIGTSGSLTSQTSIGDFVVGERLAYHDVDVTAFGYETGQLPQMDKYFATSTDSFWTELIAKFQQQDGVTLHFGDIVTGDQFINSSSKKQFINDNFQQALCAEMESTAIVHTAISFNIDCYVLRSISDEAENEADMTFDQYLSNVCKLYKTFVELLVK